MPTILITGANSFVGKNFIGSSRFKDVEEISLFDNKPAEINFSSVDVIIHLAAIVHQSKKITESEYFAVNKDLCLSVAGYAKKAGVKHFVFMSTVKVYGESGLNSKILNEDSPCLPDDSYGKSKREAEIALKQLEDTNFTVSIIRTPLVYGNGVKANMLNIIKLVDRLPVLPFGTVNNKRSFTYVGNLVAFIDRIIEKRASGLFIAKDKDSLSTSELVQLISKYLGKKVILIRIPGIFLSIGALFLPKIFNRLYGSLEFDNSKTLELLDFQPPYTTNEGIKEMVGAYLVKSEK
ncbi:MAG: NAD-dependent epimerase/dehydratase family protein [Bacteroidota bacterium]